MHLLSKPASTLSTTRKVPFQVRRVFTTRYLDAEGVDPRFDYFNKTSIGYLKSRRIIESMTLASTTVGLLGMNQFLWWLLMTGSCFFIKHKKKNLRYYLFLVRILLLKNEYNLWNLIIIFYLLYQVLTYEIGV